MTDFITITSLFLCPLAFVIALGTYNLDWRNRVIRSLREKGTSDTRIARLAWSIWGICKATQLMGLLFIILWVVGIVDFTAAVSGGMLIGSIQLLPRDFCDPNPSTATRGENA